MDCRAVDGPPLGGEAGRTTTQERSVDDFTAVQASGSIDVRITQGPDTHVEVEALEGELDDIETVVEDGTLTIRRKKAIGVRIALGQTVVRVSTPTLDAVRSTGSGDLEIEGMDVESFELRTTGSGDTRIAGKASTFELRRNGSGDVQAESFEVERASIDANGSGDTGLRATHRVEGNTNGSGDLRVTGGATCDVRSNGSGDLRC